MPLLLRVTMVAVGLPVLCVGCGWCLLTPVPHLDREERIAASGLVGTCLLAAAAFVAFLTGLPVLLFDGAVVGLAAVAAATRWRTRPLPGGFGTWPVVGLCALGYVHLLCIQALLPEYVGGLWMGDWYHHYLGARVFAGLEPVDTQWGGAGTYTVASRTPLFNLAAANVLQLAGPDFAVYQTASTFLNSCYLPVVYLLLRNLFGPRSARFGVVLAPLNLWIMHLAWFTWPKMLAVAFVLLGLHFYLRYLAERFADPPRARHFFSCFWISFLLGYLTHQAAVVYLLVLLVHALVLAWRERQLHFQWRPATFSLLSLLALLGPWYAWLVYRFGLEGTVSSTPTSQMDPDFVAAHGIAKAFYVLQSVGYNLGAAVVPFTFAVTVWNGPWTWGQFYGTATDFYFNQLTGALTLSLCLYLLVASARALRRNGLRTVRMVLARQEWHAVWAFALLGGVGTAILHPLRSINGIAHSAIFATSVLLVVLAWGKLSRAGPRVRAVVCAGMVLEFLVIFWTHVPFCYTDPLLLDPYGYNALSKRTEHLVFLSDCFGSGTVGAVAVAVAVQGLLIVLLAAIVLARPDTKQHN